MAKRATQHTLAKLALAASVSALCLIAAAPVSAAEDDGKTAASTLDAPATASSNASANISTSMTATLKIVGDVVTLGQLFANTPDDLAAKEVMQAPDIGASLSISAYQLKKIALQHGIAFEVDYTAPLVVLERDNPADGAAGTSAAIEPLVVSVVRNPVVKGRHIRLGDVLEGYYSDSNVIIGEAPAPGTRTSLAMTEIRELAALHGLTVRPTGSLAQVNITRAGTRISRQDIETLVKNAIADFGFEDVTKVSVIVEGGNQIYIPVTDSVRDVYVSGFKMTAPKKFAAELILPTGGLAPMAVAVTGTIYQRPISAAAVYQPKPAPVPARDRQLQQQPQQTDTSNATQSPLFRTAQPIGKRRTQPQIEEAKKPAEAEETVVLMAEPEKPIATLKTNILVTGGAVTLKQLFGSLPDEIEDVPVLEAPAPGTSTSIPTQTLSRIAADLGLVLDVPRHINNISIHREGIRVSLNDYLDVLKAPLARAGIGEQFDMDVNLTGRDHFLPTSATMADIRLDDLDVSFGKDRFSAILSVPSGSHQPHTVRLSGRLVETREVPVLARSFAPGEVIGANDLSYVRVPLTKVTGRVVSHAGNMIGQTVRRPVGAGDLLQTSNLIRPVAIKRGAPATMTLQSGLMTLTAAVKALGDGSTGDLIRVENLASGQVVDAKVIGPGKVAALSASVILATANSTGRSAPAAGSR